MSTTFVRSCLITMDHPKGQGFRFCHWPDNKSTLETRDSPNHEYKAAPATLGVDLVVSLLATVMDYSMAYGIVHADEFVAAQEEPES